MSDAGGCSPERAQELIALTGDGDQSAADELLQLALGRRLRPRGPWLRDPAAIEETLRASIP